MSSQFSKTHSITITKKQNSLILMPGCHQTSCLNDQIFVDRFKLMILWRRWWCQGFLNTSHLCYTSLLTTVMPSTSFMQIFRKNSLSSAFSNNCFSFLWLRNLCTLTPWERNRSIKSSRSFCNKAFSNIFLSIWKTNNKPEMSCQCGVSVSQTIDNSLKANNW